MCIQVGRKYLETHHSESKVNLTQINSPIHFEEHDEA